MITLDQLKAKIAAGEKVTLAFLGDSTTAGFGCNPGPNKWIDGNSYLCVNGGTGPNWIPGDPFEINPSGFPTPAQQANKGIPTAVRLIRTWLESLNPESIAYNFGWGGATAQGLVNAGAMASVAAVQPDAVFIATGINSAKLGASQASGLAMLIYQAQQADILTVVVKEQNPAVAGSPAGNWSASALPDNWFPMDDWPTCRANIDAIAGYYNCPICDLGTTDGAIVPELLYDPFHPSAKGYQVNFEKYRAFLGGSDAYVSIDKVRVPITPGGALRIKTSLGIVHIAVKETLGALRVKLNGIKRGL